MPQLSAATSACSQAKKGQNLKSSQLGPLGGASPENQSSQLHSCSMRTVVNLPLKFVVQVSFLITEFKEISERKLRLKFLFIAATLSTPLTTQCGCISNRIHFEPHTHHSTESAVTGLEYPLNNQRSPGFFSELDDKTWKVPVQGCRAQQRSQRESSHAGVSVTSLLA